MPANNAFFLPTRVGPWSHRCRGCAHLRWLCMKSDDNPDLTTKNIALTASSTKDASALYCAKQSGVFERQEVLV
jgi:hypothetical protein